MLQSVSQTLDNDPPVDRNLVGREKLHKALILYWLLGSVVTRAWKHLKKQNFKC